MLQKRIKNIKEWPKLQKIVAISSIALLLIVGLYLILSDDKKQDVGVCEEMLFQTYIDVDGELQAANSSDISIPEELFSDQIRVWNMKITDLVPEGTRVNKGDYVATLDPSRVEDELKRMDERLKATRDQIQEIRLDSGVNLSNMRNEIQMAKDKLIDSQLKLDQSTFESKAYQRQAQIEVDKASRFCDLKDRNYDKSKRRFITQLERQQDDMDKNQTIRDLLISLKKGIKIMAPSWGIVMYAKTWRGKKIRVGDDVGRFMPVIASLPDLNSLVSEVFVKEIDITRVSIGQDVRVKVDALSNKLFKGSIKNIAAMGQEMPGTQMNGYKVVVSLSYDTTSVLLPGMSTSNKIITSSWDKALVVPRQAVFEQDSVKYVYIKSSGDIVKQSVKVQGENDRFFRVVSGINKGDKVFLTMP